MINIEPAMTGQDVVEDFKADVEDFFEARHDFELRIEIAGNYPTCRGSGPTARIQLPGTMMGHSVEPFSDVAFLLLVLGHETAHYFHRHNEHYDESALEYRALEVWADYFGTKVVMTLGEKTA